MQITRALGDHPSGVAVSSSALRFLAGLYAILDGTLLPIDRIAARRHGIIDAPHRREPPGSRW